MVETPDDNSRQLWIYGTGEMDFTMEANQGNPIRFVGVVYAPNSQSSFSLKHAELYGSVAAGQIDIQNGGEIHYDRDLATRDPLHGLADAPTVTYLHVSVTPLNITSA